MIIKHEDYMKKQKKFSLWQRFLIWGGWLCECGGEYEDVPGWDKMTCKKCKKTIKC